MRVHRTDRKLLRDVLDTLEKVGCRFFACPGPFAVRVPMATCGVCADVYSLRRRLKLSVKDPKNRADGE